MSFQPFEREADRVEYRRHLPHWNQPGCTYFITFRLADSLPDSTLREMRAECEAWLKTHGLTTSQELDRLPIETRREYHRLFNRLTHEQLDRGHGDCLLRHPACSQIVADGFRFFDTQRYALGEFVVMPNHVHLLVTPFADWALSKLLHSWKRHSALAINRLCDRLGPLWMDERFDHAVRSHEQLRYFRQYILENPRKARLTEGQYMVGCGSDVGD